VQVIIIEGLPGSGKTSLAEWLCDNIKAQGYSVSWIPELQRDHPVIDRSTIRTAKVEGYARRCIAGWTAFSKLIQALEYPHVFIVEGCLFQSTVRFLIENERPANEIEEYLHSVEACLAPLRPHLIYLTQTNVKAYLESEVDCRKGREIVSRIIRYSETTPYSISRGLEGRWALVSLYISYRNVCDRLIQNSKLPILKLDAVYHSEAVVRDRVSRWVSMALVN
jgi:hypothetical protein